MAPDEVAQNGWHAVPRDAGVIFGGKPYVDKPGPLLVSDMAFPSEDPVVAKVRDFAAEKLPRQTLHHSMRVYYYSTAIMAQQFRERAAGFSASTLALTCLLHDVGTARELLAASRMSFEFYGGIKARELVVGLGGAQDQADAVGEAIIRHQDLGVDGTITLLGQVVQLATVFDNVGAHPTVDGYAEMLHEDTREDVIRAFPREGWLGCFAATVREEIRLKPWCHTTHIPDFASRIEGIRS
ncbi:Cyanamide hydratase [Tolypocladium capitatum]|uniref:Cyanamide hydratase n=1 Tax=Tolypocladium capitatum TaxID=45235 RepID=A0A2K3QJT2_9HYPO|nr:Cyanamide hydratase [Tolypocladium capitatum]